MKKQKRGKKLREETKARQKTPKLDKPRLPPPQFDNRAYIPVKCLLIDDRGVLWWVDPETQIISRAREYGVDHD